MSKEDRALPLHITRTDKGTYSVLLNGMELAGVLQFDGVRIEWVGHSDGIPHFGPRVTLTFAPDSLDLDLDAMLVEYLLASGQDVAL